MIILLYSFSGGRNKNDLSQGNLKGLVKLTTERRYAAEKPEILTGKDVTRYNRNGNLEEEVSYSGADSVLSERRVHFYNTDGFKMHSEIYGSELRWKYLYKINAFGKITEAQVIFPNGDKGMRMVYIDDIVGNTMEMQVHWPSESLDIERGVVKTIFQYDDKGQCINQINYKPDGNLSYVVSCKYNHKKDMSETRSFGKSSIPECTERYEYEYDRLDNWINKMIFINDILKAIVNREIEYYP